MARVIKIDNVVQKRFAKKEKQAQEKEKREIKIYFLIVCEGAKTEPNYFKSFPKQIGKYVFDLNFDGGGISTKKVVEKAIELRDNSSQNMIEFGQYLIKTVFLLHNSTELFKKLTQITFIVHGVMKLLNFGIFYISNTVTQECQDTIIKKQSKAL